MEGTPFIIEDFSFGRFWPTYSCEARRRRLGHQQMRAPPVVGSASASSGRNHNRQLQLASSLTSLTSPMALTSGLHTCNTPTTDSTSSKSPYLRPRPPATISDLMKSPQIPRLNMRSLLFHSSYLLLIICSTVPNVSSASVTGLVSRSIGESGLSALSSSPSSFSRRSEPVPHDDANGLFGGFVGEEDNSNQMKCVYYNKTQCKQTGKGCGNHYQICHSRDSTEHPSLCYALWRNSTDIGVEVEFKGCWLGHSKDCAPEDHQSNHCVQTMTPNRNSKNSKANLFFCCCNGSKCNRNLKHVPFPPESVLTSTETPPFQQNQTGGTPHGPKYNFYFYLLLGLGVFFLMGVVSVVVFLFGKYRNKPNSGDVPQTHEPLLENSNLNGIIGYVGLNPIKLKEIRAQGKFGSVWLATDGRENMVAVKVFAMQDRNSWQTEKDVFCLPQMKHNNILTYLGAERRGEGLDVEYWLITEYHPNGSLWDYLKSHTVNLKQLLTIIQGIGAGLTHLHEELPPTMTERGKPSIAHRDFKSKNVLLSSNFRACIADFGLAIVFHPNAILGDAHGQVGTRRYMSPEVLEGAINFNRESFLRIDMYACGLVLWELLSRTCFGDITCAEYRLPFEEEVGIHPSLEDMQVVVSQEKKRPKMADAWFKHPALAIVANTVQDCWDQDTEARISASTICERIQSLILNEDNCLSLNNHNGSATYRVAFPSNQAAPVPASTGIPKNAFLLTTHQTSGPITGANSTTANGSTYIRETST